MYGHKKITDVNEARYCSFIKMTGGFKVSSKVKKINCATLPHCPKVLDQHLLWVNRISMLWRHAHTTETTRDIHPHNFGWREDGNGQYLPLCFKGETLSENIPNYNGEIETENGSYDDVRDIDNENLFYKNGYAEFNCESDYDCDEYQSYFFYFLFIVI